MNVNWEQLFPTLGISIQPSRWEHFRVKLQHLSRNGVRAWAEAILLGANFADDLYLSREQLATKYEGKKPTPQVDGTNVAIDKVVTSILGGAPLADTHSFGAPIAVEGVNACNWALDDPAVQNP